MMMRGALVVNEWVIMCEIFLALSLAHALVLMRPARCSSCFSRFIIIVLLFMYKFPVCSDDHNRVCLFIIIFFCN